MLYSFVRPIARESLKRFYRKIDLVGRERIPKNAAVILAANHPTAFIEPCILACFLDRPLHFLVRGDFFRKPLYARLLRALHMLPVYRMKDGGYQNIKQNYETFKACFNALSAHKTLMILAEGRCIHEKRLRPLRKGAARIALGALDDNAALGEVYIVPVGVNFTNAEQVRSSVMVRFGEPIRVSEYLESYRLNPNGAITQLTDELAIRLRGHVLHIDRHEDELLVENLLRLGRARYPRSEEPTVTHEPEQLEREMAITRGVNALPESERHQLNNETNRFFGRLDHLRLDADAVAGNYKREQRHTGRLALALPAAVLITLWHLPPLMLAQWIAGTKIREMEFYQSVHWAGLTVGYLVYVLLWMLITALAGAWVLLLIGLACLFLGYRALRVFERLRAGVRAWRAWRQIPEERKRLREQYQDLVARLTDLVNH